MAHASSVHRLFTIFISLTNIVRSTNIWKIKMKPHSAAEPDEYRCISYPVRADKSYYIVHFAPKVVSKNVHHMILFGCANSSFQQQQNWDCNSGETMHSPCQTKMSILYAWTMDASDVELPKDVSFKVGRGTVLKYLVLQIHYKDPFVKPDTSGVDVSVSLNPTRKRAGLLLLASDGYIQPYSMEYFEMARRIDENIVLHPFAYRVHAHALGLVNSAYHVFNENGRQFWTEIGRRSPQLAQNFVAANPGIAIKYGDWVTGICTMYNPHNRLTRIGSTREDEMCNIYILYWVWGDRILSDSITVAPGPPDFYFENLDERLDVSVIPSYAYTIPDAPNGINDPTQDMNIMQQFMVQ